MALTLVTSDLIGGLDYSKLTGTVPTWNQNTTGSAATLTTARTIGGVSFNGSAAINLPGVNAAGNQNTSGTAAGLSATLAVGSGGTGVTSITALKNVLDDETWTFANNITATGTLTVNGTGNSAFNGDLYIVGKKLDISAPSGGNAYVKFSDTNSSAKNWRVGTSLSSRGVFNIYNETDDLLAFNVLANGNVGIGTTSPSGKLHIRTSTNFNYEFEEVSSKLRLSALNDARSANVPLQFAASEFNFITGNVGIGTTSPGSKLTINGTVTIGSQPAASWISNRDIIQLGDRGNINAINSSGNIYLNNNIYVLANGNNASVKAGGASQIRLSDNEILFYTSNVASAADEVITLSSRLVINSDGNPVLASGQSLYTQGTGRVYTHNVTLREQDNTAKFQIYSSGGGCVFYNNESNGAYYFYTNGAERMRIASNATLMSSDGNGWYFTSFLLSNDGSTGNYRWQFYLSGNDLVLNDRHYGTVLSSPTGTGKIKIAQLAASSITNLNVTVNGELTTATSDGSLKENVEDINYGIDEVLKLKPVSYYWKDKEYGSDKEIGFIAQDIEKVIPEVVTENIKTKLKNVNYEKLTSLLTKAIQEQQAQIELLKQEVESLKQ